MSTPQTPDTQTPTAAEPKAARARWSDAMCAAILANRDPVGPVAMLLKALRACNLPHRVADETLGAPTGTAMKYLRSGKAQYFMNADGADCKLDDDVAFALVESLAALKLEGAFTSRGLDTSAVLRVVMQRGSAAE